MSPRLAATDKSPESPFRCLAWHRFCRGVRCTTTPSLHRVSRLLLINGLGPVLEVPELTRRAVDSQASEAIVIGAPGFHGRVGARHALDATIGPIMISCTDFHGMHLHRNGAFIPPQQPSECMAALSRGSRFRWASPQLYLTKELAKLVRRLFAVEVYAAMKFNRRWITGTLTSGSSIRSFALSVAQRSQPRCYPAL